MLQSIPTLLIPVLIYFIAAFLLKGEGVDTTEYLNTVLFEIGLKSGEIFKFSISSLIMLIALLSLFIEVIKATSMSKLTLVDHGLSTVLFIFCLVCFIILPAAGTALFFILTVATLVDVMAGALVSLRMARRDLAIAPGILGS